MLLGMAVLWRVPHTLFVVHGLVVQHPCEILATFSLRQTTSEAFCIRLMLLRNALLTNKESHLHPSKPKALTPPTHAAV